MMRQNAQTATGPNSALQTASLQCSTHLVAGVLCAFALVFAVLMVAPGTASAAESDTLSAATSATLSDQSDGDGTSALYRLYNPYTGEHFYTTSADERKRVVKSGWRPEGVGWVSPNSSDIPVYRVYNPYAGDHHYTTSVEERDKLVKVGWRAEGMGWYSSDASSVPVYRLYNPNATSGAHHYTMSAEERDWLAGLGWRYEGVCWYCAAPGYSTGDWVEFLDVSSKTSQIITVEATGTRATVTLHSKVNGVWQQVVATDDGWVGEAGLGPAAEGVSYTPTGVMWPDVAFGIQPNPGCPMGYLQVDWSHYWVGDSGSPLYNQLVSTDDRTDFDYWSSEHLVSMGAAYNYCLNMGWNKACTPHGGSAFFLHCSTGKPTGGCVSVPESVMVTIMKNVRPGCAIVIGNPSSIMTY